MILDGKRIADDLYTALGERRAKIDRPISLGIIVAGANPVIEQFVRIKSRAAETLDIAMVRVDLPESATTEDGINAVRDLAPRVDALIVQLPLPARSAISAGMDTNAVLSEIPREKDVDAISPIVSDNERPVFAPVALAVEELLKRGGVDIQGKRTVIVGAGRLVGAPTAVLLRKLGADTRMFTLDEGSIEDLKTADIVVSGAGNPGFIKPQHIKEGAVLIDAGASEQAGVVVGDIDPSCAGKASVFTPVPGGVGPVAVAMIFRNLFDLVEANRSG
jgi:methylenetetrahydrofolate dehydrogenase (NADP+)/methenyltetrahydrofolate cyclohydrolase